METLLIVFIVVTSVAVVIQMAILLALYMAVRNSSARIESLAHDVQTRAVPTLDAAQAMIADYRPKLDLILANAAETTTLVKQEVARLDASVGDIVDRARLQVIRADELMSRTLDRVEQATDLVHHTVVSPVQKASGLVQGVTTALGILFGRNRRGPTRVRQEDDMFI